MWFIRIINKCKSILLMLIRSIPIISGLPDIRWEDFMTSVNETVVTVLISTMPIWLGAFLVMVEQDISFNGYWLGLDTLTRKGELILYASSLLAPVIWILFWDKPNKTRFPSKTSHFVCVFMILVISAGFYAKVLLGAGEGKAGIQFFSSIIFGLSIFILLIAQAYRNNIVDPAKEFANQEHDFDKNYQRNSERRGRL